MNSFAFGTTTSIVYVKTVTERFVALFIYDILIVILHKLPFFFFFSIKNFALMQGIHI